MKKFTPKFTHTVFALYILSTFITGFSTVQAQQYKYDPGGTNNSFPFSAAATGSNRLQWLYLATTPFVPAIPAGGGNITNVYFKTGSAAVNAAYSNFTISFTTTPITTLATGAWNAPLTQAYFSATFTIPSAPIGTWVMVPLQTPWLWNGSSNFIIDVQSSALAGTGFTIPQATVLYNGRLFGNYLAATGTAGAQLACFGFDMTPPFPCAGKPVAGFINPINPCPNTNFTLSLGGVPTTQGSGISYEWQKRVGTGPWSILGTNQTATDNINVATDYRLIITCANTLPPNNADTTPVYHAQISNFLYCYCIPTYSLGGANDYISNVHLGPLNKASTGNVTPYYSDYTGLQPSVLPIPPLTLGTTDTVHVTFGPDATQYCGVWVDYSRNGLFEPTEYVTTGTSPGASGTLHIPLIVPPTASVGLTRMRIRGGDNTPMNANQPCGPTNSSNGESEDYLVEIRYPDCTGPANAGTVLTTDTAMCPNFFFTLTDTTHSINAYGLSWLWQESITSGNIWNTVQGSAGKDTLTRMFSNTVWYRLRAICSVTGDTTYSNIVKINLKPPYKCYCYSTAIVGPTDTSDIGAFSIGTFTMATGGPHLSNPDAIKGRTDYTDLGPITLYADSTFKVQVFHSMSSATHGDARVTIFMDFNNNLTYDVPSEAIYLTTTDPQNDWLSTGTLWYCVNDITIPHAVIPYVPTGMRVIINNDIAPNVPSDLACGPYTSGETEDYTVIFKPKPLTSVQQIKGLDMLAVYPNPNSGLFTVSFTSAFLLKNVDITVQDITGRMITRENFTDVNGSFKQQFNLSSQSKGVYFVEIKADGQKQTSKILVR